MAVILAKIPLGIASFEDLRKDKQYLYIDKTDQIYYLVNNQKFCLLTRPRRFGKSLPEAHLICYAVIACAVSKRIERIIAFDDNKIISVYSAAAD